jgi:hypothetical protein
MPVALRDWASCISGRTYQPPCRQTVLKYVVDLGLEGVEVASQFVKSCMRDGRALHMAGYTWSEGQVSILGIIGISLDQD